MRNFFSDKKNLRKLELNLWPPSCWAKEITTTTRFMVFSFSFQEILLATVLILKILILGTSFFLFVRAKVCFSAVVGNSEQTQDGVAFQKQEMRFGFFGSNIFFASLRGEWEARMKGSCFIHLSVSLFLSFSFYLSTFLFLLHYFSL